MKLERITCKIFGHHITGLDVKNRTATCHRCKAHLQVSYDPAYGNTIVDRAIYDKYIKPGTPMKDNI